MSRANHKIEGYYRCNSMIDLEMEYYDQTKTRLSSGNGDSVGYLVHLKPDSLGAMCYEV